MDLRTGGSVQVSQIIAELDKEIARLQEARSLLTGTAPKRRRGRPPLSAKANVAEPVTKKRTAAKKSKRPRKA